MSFFGFGKKADKKDKKEKAKKQVEDDDDDLDTKKSAAAAADDDGDDGGAGDDDGSVVVEPFESIKSLCMNESLADVYFVVGKEKGKTERIPGHRLILSAGNAVFRALLYPLVVAADGKSARYVATAAADEKDIVVDDATPGAFRKMLTAIYTDDVEVTADDVTELIALAKRYQVDTLKALCVEFLEQDVTAEKACTLFVEGRKLLNEPAFGLAFIEEHMDDIAKTDGFVDLPRDCLETLLRSNKLSIDEGDLWSAVDRWAAAECKRQGSKVDGKAKREVLGNTLHLVRFPLLEMQDLCVKVQPTNVLSQEELLSLFTYAAAPVESKPKIAFAIREREGGGNKVQIHEFKWSDKLSNGARVRCEGNRVTSTAPTCNRDVLAIADTKGWSRGVHYWRINVANGGCYRRVGVVDGEFDRTKYGDGNPQHGTPAVLGATANSWGANVQSAHMFGEPNVFSGAVNRFGSGEVGVLLDLNKKTMHLYSNGQFVATAFTNIKGKKLRPAVQMCHNGCSCYVLPAQGTVAPVVPK